VVIVLFFVGLGKEELNKQRRAKLGVLHDPGHFLGWDFIVFLFVVCLKCKSILHNIKKQIRVYNFTMETTIAMVS
jgi:hypothetical protein